MPGRPGATGAAGTQRRESGRPKAKAGIEAEAAARSALNIVRWTRRKGGYLPQCHAEWKQLVEQHSWEVLREMLLDESDEGQRLRSSHPFVGIVTEQERAKIHAP